MEGLPTTKEGWEGSGNLHHFGGRKEMDIYGECGRYLRTLPKHNRKDGNTLAVFFSWFVCQASISGFQAFVREDGEVHC